MCFAGTSAVDDSHDKVFVPVWLDKQHIFGVATNANEAT